MGIDRFALPAKADWAVRTLVRIGKGRFVVWRVSRFSRRSNDAVAVRGQRRYIGLPDADRE